ncbi:hypothetical protein D3C85_504490 [compost metagenome]
MAPWTERVSTFSTPLGGSTRRRLTSGAAVVPMRMMTARPSWRTRAREPTAPANSILVKPVLAPTRISTGPLLARAPSACGARGANTTTPAAAAATVVFRTRFLAVAPDIRAHPRAKGFNRG